MIGRIKYRGVVFGIHAVASTHNGHTVVRPIDVGALGIILNSKDISKCVGRAVKVAEDKNSDDFGVRIATYRAYRILIGMVKVQVQKVIKAYDGMQAECRADQDRLHNRQYPKEKISTAT